MRRTHRFATLCGIAALGLIAVAPAALAKEIGFREVAYGTVSDATVTPVEPAAHIVRDVQAARALLPVWGMDRALARVAAVDFTRRSLVVLLGGWRPNPGYAELVGAIDVAGPAATVTATVIRRAGGNAEVLARPWVIVSVPRAAVASAAPDVRVAERCAAQARCRPPFG